MTATFRAVLIDPAECRIDICDFDGNGATLGRIVGADTLDHFLIAKHPDVHDYGWVDDDGLTRGQPVHAFKFREWRNPVAGRCLIVGADRAGETVNPKITVDFIKQHIDWLGLIVPEVFIDPTETGFRTIVTYAKAK